MNPRDILLAAAEIIEHKWADPRDYLCDLETADGLVDADGALCRAAFGPDIRLYIDMGRPNGLGERERVDEAIWRQPNADAYDQAGLVLTRLLWDKLDPHGQHDDLAKGDWPEILHGLNDSPAACSCAVKHPEVSAELIAATMREAAKAVA